MLADGLPRFRDIAVGVLTRGDGRLLIARRRLGTPGGGRWEFPGGKQEPGEMIEAALARELAEEIGIQAPRGAPLIRFAHAYGPKPVRLHVWCIHDWLGRPAGREGQQLRWVMPDELLDFDVLPATDIIKNALDMEARYLITPPAGAAGERAWQAGLERALTAGIGLFRVRDHGIGDAAYAARARAAIAIAGDYGARVVLDRDAGMAASLGAHGLHWPLERLRAAGGAARVRKHGPLWIGVSVHTGEALAAAVALGADFATLSPVAATATHPNAAPLGWAGFAAARADHPLPVYALGGLGSTDMARARDHNAQGIAAIRGFWPAWD